MSNITHATVAATALIISERDRVRNFDDPVSQQSKEKKDEKEEEERERIKGHL